MKTQRGTGTLAGTATSDAPAFTRLELAALLAVLALFAALALPALANNRERSQRVVCVNNLRLAGQAIHEWGTEKDGRLPWRTSYLEGGTMLAAGSVPPIWAGLQNASWFQWAWISNELRTPKILSCPSDAGKVQATDWSSSNPGGGFRHLNFQNKAVSYLIGLDVFQENSDGLVAGDRNVAFNGGVATCSSGVTPAWSLIPQAPSSFGIGAGLHVGAGNFLFKDGHVEELSSQGFVRKINNLYGGTDNGAVHYLTP